MRFTRTHSQTAKLNPVTHRKLDEFLWLARHLYNAALQERIDAYEKTGKAPSFYDQCKSLTVIRSEDEQINQYGVKPFRSVLNRLDSAYKRFFKHGGYPRFKGRHRGIRSFETPQYSIKASGKYHNVVIKGFGKFRVRQIPNGNIKLIRVVKTPLRVTVQFVTEYEAGVKPDNSPAIGVDLGIEKQATLSTGYTLSKVVIDTTRMKRLQRRLSKAVKGSHSRHKKRLALVRESQRIAERQRNTLHRTTTDLVRKHGANWAVEDLRIRNMVRNHRLARSIFEQQWGTFIQQLTYKAESAGGTVTKVNPKNTSKTCSRCGSQQEMPLNRRVFECESCGLSLDRDWNAAINIRDLSPGGNSPGAWPDAAPTPTPVVALGTTRNSMPEYSGI